MPAELGFLGPLIGLVKEVGAYAFRKFRKPDPVALLENRRKWKAEFYNDFPRRQVACELNCLSELG